MHYKYIPYLLFSLLCVAKPPPGGPQDGLSGRQHHILPGGPQDGLSGSPQPPQPGGPHDGLPGAEDDDTLTPSDSDNRPVPSHSFVKKVLVSKNSCSNETLGNDNKVFVKFIQGPFTLKKRREKAGRVTFTCNSCEKFNHYLPVVAWRERVDDDQENDNYILDVDTLPSLGEHVCGSTGIEDLVRNFRSELELQAEKDPTQPFPTLYQTVR